MKDITPVSMAKEQELEYFEGLQKNIEAETGEKFDQFEAIEVVEDEENVDQFLASSKDRRGSTFKVKYRMTITANNYPAFYKRATIMRPNDPGDKAEILKIEEFGED